MPFGTRRRAASLTRSLFALALLSAIPLGANAQVVISQVYGGGGNAGATYTNDFVELFNRGTTPQSLNGLSVQYASATGTIWNTATLTNVSLAAGQYYLVQLGSSGAIGAPLPTPDATNAGINMSATNGKVALVSNTTALSGACPLGGTVLDFIGFGTANCREGVTNAPAGGNALALVRAGGGCTDAGENSTDFATATPAARNTGSPGAPCAAPTPTVTINDISAAETNGATTFTFTVTLSNGNANGTDFTVDVATADVSANAGSDYTALPLGTQVTFDNAAASETQNVLITVTGDTTPEPNETFQVNLSNATGGVTIGDGTGIGTIQNDDFANLTISQIQGTGTSSPFAGATNVRARGIVTAKRPNTGTSRGFWIQSQPADVDADPTSSEGLFVFAGSTSIAGFAVGDLVDVTGNVVEFIPTQDPQQRPITQIAGGISVTIVTPAQALPTAVDLSLPGNAPTAAGGIDQLERFEHMRVLVPSFTATAPNGGNTNEVNATGTDSGFFWGVITGTPLPLRETGIDIQDLLPAIAPANVPRWDFNPELLSVNTTRLEGGVLIPVRAGRVLTSLVGVLDSGFRRYTVLPDPAAPPTPGAQPGPIAVSNPIATEVTIASYNVERFFDTVNDPAITEPVLTATAFDNRLNKLSLAVRDFLKTPDIIGFQEVENLTTLQAMATRINNDAVAALQPNPLYQPHLVEGNDVGGIDVGFLVKTGEVSAGVARVSVIDVVQEGDPELLRCPDGTPVAGDLLNDRPALRLRATVNAANGGAFPITAFVVHHRSLSGVEDETPAGGALACFGTDGERVRRKRQQQAEFLATLVQARQLASPNERIVLLGDFNAFEFNDGYGDILNAVSGTPTPNDQTVVGGDGVDLVTVDLENLFATTPAAEQYSFIFDGTRQSLDHMVANGPLLGATTAATRIEHARINADFLESDRSNAAVPMRLSDHDPTVGFFDANSFYRADLALTGSAAPSPVDHNSLLTYSLTLTNNGPDAAINPAIALPLPANTEFVALPAPPAGWSCMTPAVGANGTVSCSIASLANAANSSFSILARPQQAAGGTTVSTTATSSAGSSEAAAGNESVLLAASVNPNDAPVAATDSHTVDEDSASATVTVLLNDTDPEGDARSVTAVTQPAAGGSVVLNAGVVSFTPAANFNGPTSFTYTVSDGALTAVGTVNVTVNPVNDAPTISDTADHAANEDVADVVNFTINDIDTALACTAANLSATSGNTALVPVANIVFSGTAPNCSATITPVANEVGNTLIRITVSDGTAVAFDEFLLAVLAVNDAPSFTAGANRTVAEDAGAQTVTGWATAISAGPANESAQTLSFEIVSNSNTPLFSVAGPVTVASDGTLTFTPEVNANGSATIEVRIVDNGGTANGGVDTSNTQTFTITVNAVNDAPTISVIADVTTRVNDIGTATFSIADVDNALSCSNANLSATASTNTTLLPLANVSFGGTLSNCQATLVPVAGQTGFSDVTFTVSDGNAIATRTFRFTVNPNRIFANGFEN